MIRSLDIRPGERWTPGRVAIHMAHATAPDATLPGLGRRRRLWPIVLWVFLAPSCFALAIIAAWQILRRGLSL